jgi:hypothetical protein
MCLAAGECAALVHNVEPAAQIVREMMDEALAVIKGRLQPLTD